MCITMIIDTHDTASPEMRTNIVIDDQLMREALRVSGLQTKKDVVELGLRTLIRLKKQAGLRSLRGKLRWEGDLDEMRERH